MSRVVIAAGGTGGHFFPAEALAGQLASRGHDLVLMTDRRGGLRSHGAFANAPQHVIAGAGVAGRGRVAKLRGLAAVARGVVQARRLLATLEADAVVGFGGYPSVAPLLAARLLGRGRPAIVVHEGNAVLGQANAQLARFADRIATSFEVTVRLPPGRGTLTGMPVRDEIAALAASPYPGTGGTLNLLIWGGSLGARIFSDVVPAAMAPFAGRVRVVQQARAEDVDRVRAAYAAAGIDAEIAPFLDRVAERLAAAHLVIGRAGGSSVAELACIGRPSILVPLPIAASDEQTANARALVAAGAAWIVPQRDFTEAALSALLAELFAALERLAEAAAAAAALGRHDAASRLADLVEGQLRASIEWGSGACSPQRSPEASREGVLRTTPLAFFKPEKQTEQSL
ncbi:undecaprenyldiphospho-muramoylpentapeptide beta-N-acetylglucosaminyltransferase [Lichenicoccus sp.]|uniref:undecaprenyldiphospho-muramoylpentapeptide beta-N-acetylglucosaminyltransferase n=1 Tax=Lichenicoccus sp. TaxID=2781899 RepID=UPI003D0B4DDE